MSLSTLWPDPPLIRVSKSSLPLALDINTGTPASATYIAPLLIPDTMTTILLTTDSNWMAVHSKAKTVLPNNVFRPHML